MLEYKFFLARIFPYKDTIEESVLIRESADQRKRVFWHTLHKK